MTNSAEDRLRRGYRVVRLITAGSEAPWAGALISGPTGETVLAVDAALLGPEWTGWDAASSGHVLTPVDVLRRTDGHDVLLPVCTERVEEFLTRRASGGSDLTPGEGVTLAVSLMRGLGELPGLADDVRGEWWLTEAGRPVLATDRGAMSLESHTFVLLDRIATDVPMLADALRDAPDAVTDPRRRSRELGRREEMLFAAADPLPLATTTFGPRRARHRLPMATEPDAEPLEPAESPWPLTLSRHLDADWADLVSRTTTGVWRAMRTRRSGGRRPWLVAGGVAGAILVGGLVWPAGAGGPATAGADSAIASPESSAAADPASSPTSTPTGMDASATSPSAEEAVDLISITGTLLTARIDCAGDPTCLEAVIEAGAGRFPPGVVDLAPDERSLTLLDEFGGVAVARVDAVASAITSQLVVIVQDDDRWLLRDVYDVAEQ
ncbi:hypothetical protein SAMN04487846_1945 [Microbacterium sp. cf046]|uniref:hypothetical protein n=1 Tax=Microbacterium sp. cf046 TaxID=1761803 RepID=UPI0008E80E0D|nr:hypothetical protein [Microbacterium sp. cf046]SFS05193.1 hypothetical protein SAMN04487846_1945 [Microbacterium sp. cf046]